MRIATPSWHLLPTAAGRNARDGEVPFIRLTEAITELSDRLGAGFSQEEIGSLSTSTVNYSGWWMQPEYAGLSAVVRLNVSLDQFLARAIALFKVIELLRPAPLRNLVLKIGVPREKIQGFAALKLLGTLLQLSALARENGYDFWKDASIVVGSWDTNKLLPEMNRLFALNGLRVLAAHVPGSEKDKRLAELTKSFGIDLGDNVTGWGLAIDALYDGIAADMEAIAGFLEAVCD